MMLRAVPNRVLPRAQVGAEGQRSTQGDSHIPHHHVRLRQVWLATCGTVPSRTSRDGNTHGLKSPAAAARP